MTGTSITFACPLPLWVALLLGACALAVVAVFVSRDVARLRKPIRATILGGMMLAGLMLIGIILHPRLIHRRPDEHKPRCVLLADASRSMLLADTYAGAVVTRERVVQAILSASPDGVPARLREMFALSAWRFSAGLEGFAVGAGAAGFSVDEAGYVSALGDALAEAGKGVGSTRPRVVILISDGAWNRGRDPAEVARRLSRAGTPVFVLGVGDPNPPKDIALTGLRAPRQAILGEEVVLAAQVVAHGMGTARVSVKLSMDGEVIAEKQVTPDPGGRPTEARFTHVPLRPGYGKFMAVVEKQAGERTTDNNSASASVEIVERNIKALIIESEPRWEYRFVRSVLERDPSVTPVACLLRPGVGPMRGPGYVAEVPTQKKDLAEYDLIIIGDVTRAQLPDAFLREVAEMVRHRGAALLIHAGKRDRYRELAGTPLEKILPVKLEGAFAAGMSPGEYRPELTPEGAGHLALRLASSDEDNAAAWSRLPPLRWSAGVGGVTRGARVLLAHPHRLAGASRLPLLCTQRVGSGKVMFCGIAETWRWRKTVGDKFHYRFWAQVARWLTRKQFTEGDPRARLSLDRADCEVGEAVQIEAYCLGEDGFPLDDAKVRLRIEHDRGAAVELAMRPAPGGWGMYRASFVPEKKGKYTIRPMVAAYGEAPLASSVTLEASLPDVEKNALAQNRALLEAVAEAGDGKYLAAREAGELPRLLKAQIEQRFLTSEYSPTRHWVYYSVMALALAIAWLTRKRNGLA